MSADQKGKRPTIRGFFEEDTPVHSFRPTDERNEGGGSSQVYHPPASPPVPPAHRTIETKLIQLSSEIDPRRALTQKLLVRRPSPFVPPGLVAQKRVNPRWSIALAVSLLVIVSSWFGWQQMRVTQISTDAAGSGVRAPTFAQQPLPTRVQVAANLPKAATLDRSAPTTAAAPEPEAAVSPEAQKNSKVNSGLDHVQPHRDSTAHESGHSGTSTPPHAPGEGQRPREVWLQ